MRYTHFTSAFNVAVATCALSNGPVQIRVRSMPYHGGVGEQESFFIAYGRAGT
jgi:hypothetical protein